MIYQQHAERGAARTRDARASRFNIARVALGLAFLYLPIAILVIYSFNASRLVTVWGGWSSRWYVALLHDSAMLEAAWISCASRFCRRRRRPCSAPSPRSRWCASAVSAGAAVSGMIYAPLVMPEVIIGLSLLLLFVAVDSIAASGPCASRTPR
jgi:putrescine transport system permease protein